MLTFNSVDDLWVDSIKTILIEGSELPSRDGPTREVLGYCARLSQPKANFLFNPVRKINPSYAAAELLWILSGRRTIQALQPYAPQYTRFCDVAVLLVDENNHEFSPVSKGGLPRRAEVMYAHGAYGSRLWRNLAGLRSIDLLIHLLKSDPNTRQAVLTFYDTGQDQVKATLGNKKDIPCTLSLNFIIRDGKLNCLGTMRSQDVWLGLPHDIFVFTCLQQLIAEAVGVDVGWYQHSLMSLHLYDRNKAKAIEAADRQLDALTTRSIGYEKHPKDPFSLIADAVQAEEVNRLSGIISSPLPIGHGTMLHQLVIMAAHKWLDLKRINVDNITSPAMAKYMEEHWC